MTSGSAGVVAMAGNFQSCVRRYKFMPARLFESSCSNLRLVLLDSARPGLAGYIISKSINYDKSILSKDILRLIRDSRTSDIETILSYNRRSLADPGSNYL